MPGHVRIEDKDNGYKAMLARLKKAQTSLTVGLHEAEGAAPKAERVHGHERPAGKTEGSKGGGEGGGGAPKEQLTLVDVGMFHEFGLGVPRRSFIADWSDENRSNHENQLRLMAKAVVQGKVASWQQGLARLGNLYVAEIQKRISDHIQPELAESTIRQKTVGGKKGDVPLIDTGQLRTGIRFHINGAEGGGGEEGGGEGEAGGEGGGGGSGGGGAED